MFYAILDELKERDIIRLHVYIKSGEQYLIIPHVWFLGDRSSITYIINKKIL